MSDIEELYKEMEKKAKLPAFKDLDNEFEISDIDEVSFFLRKIRRKMMEKIELFTKILENILHPESDFSSMVECRDSNEKDMKDAFDVYKKLKIIEKDSGMLDLHSEYRAEANFINHTYNQWISLKASLAAILKRTNQCWEKEESKIPFGNYVG